MKKLFIFTLVIIGLFFVSCSKEQRQKQPFKKIETELAYVIPDSIYFEENYSSNYYHVVVDGDNLYDLSEYYLGNSTLWGQLLVENPQQIREADSRSFRVVEKNGPGWLLFEEEIILLPNHVNMRPELRSMGSSSNVTFKLGNKSINYFLREIPVEQDMSKLTTINQDLTPANEIVDTIHYPTTQETNYFPWVWGVFKFLATILLVLLVLTGIGYLLHLLFNGRPFFGSHSNNNTPDGDIVDSFNTIHIENFYENDPQEEIYHDTDLSIAIFETGKAIGPNGSAKIKYKSEDGDTFKIKIKKKESKK